MSYINTIEMYYDGQSESEWLRLTRHRLEFEITKKALDEYIRPGSRVLDVGGGPGRYSIHLAGRGCTVTLLDLSAENVYRAEIEADKAGVQLEAAVHGNALELRRLFADRTFDAVLCMGPIYHLQDESERISVMDQCIALLNPSGIFFAAFISAYAPMLDSLRKYPETITGSSERYLAYLIDGRNYVAEGFTDAYFIHPHQIAPFMAGFPLEKLGIIAAEGLGVLVEPALLALPEAQFMQWVELFYRIAGNPEVYGACEHLLYIGRKKSS